MLLWRNIHGDATLDGPGELCVVLHGVARELRQVRRPRVPGPARPGPCRDRPSTRRRPRTRTEQAHGQAVLRHPRLVRGLDDREQAQRQGQLVRRSPTVDGKPPGSSTAASRPRALQDVTAREPGDRRATRAVGAWSSRAPDRRGGSSSSRSSCSIVSFFTFCLVRLLPGDPTTTIIPFGTDTQQRAAAEGPRPRQAASSSSTGTTSATSSQGDLGHQYSTNRPVIDLVNQSLPVSIELMIYAQLIVAGVRDPTRRPRGVPRRHAYRPGDQHDGVRAARAAELRARARCSATSSGAQLKWLPTGGYAPGWLDPIFDSTRHMQLGDHLRYMFLPAITLAVGQIAVYMRLLRSDMIATLQENFITMAQGEGHPEPPHPLAARAPAVEPHAAHRRRSQRRDAHRRRRRRRGDLQRPGDGREDLPGDRRQRVRGAPELHPRDRRPVRDRELLRRLPVHRARPEDPPCPSSRPEAFAATGGRAPSTTGPSRSSSTDERSLGDVAGRRRPGAPRSSRRKAAEAQGPRLRRVARDRLDGVHRRASRSSLSSTSCRSTARTRASTASCAREGPVRRRGHARRATCSAATATAATCCSRLVYGARGTLAPSSRSRRRRAFGLHRSAAFLGA